MSEYLDFIDTSCVVTRPRLDEIDYAQREGYQPFFITFGFGQAFPNGCVCIWGRDREQARSKMEELFGSKWSFDYDLDGIRDYASKYPLKLVGEYVA